MYRFIDLKWLCKQFECPRPCSARSISPVSSLRFYCSGWVFLVCWQHLASRKKNEEIDCDRCKKKWTNSPLEHKVNLGYNNMCKLHKLTIFLCVWFTCSYVIFNGNEKMLVDQPYTSNNSSSSDFDINKKLNKKSQKCYVNSWVSTGYEKFPKNNVSSWTLPDDG